MRSVVRCVLAAAICCTSVFAFNATAAFAQGSGFTGGFNYRCDAGTISCGPAAAHSWGFNSAAYKGNGSWSLGSYIYVFDPGPFVPGGYYQAFAQNPNRVARICTNGYFPFCQDYDGHRGKAYIYEYYRHTIFGHGVY